MSSLGKVGFYLSIVYDALLLLLLNIPSMLAALLSVILPRSLKDIKNEVVLVTGSGQGLGRELALLFTQQGCEVVCVDINPESNEETVRQARALGGRAKGYICNVADREAVRKLEETVGRVDILVNNAAVFPFQSLWDSSEEEIRAVIDINLLGQCWTVQAFLPGMKERNHGHVVCISSMCALLGQPNAIPYTISKYGVAGLMATLGLEMHAEKKNVQLTTVYPFLINTRPEMEECVQSRIPALSLREAAENILQGVRENLVSFTVPRHLLHLTNVARFLPKSFEKSCMERFPITVQPPKVDLFKEQIKKKVFKQTGKVTVQNEHRP